MLIRGTTVAVAMALLLMSQQHAAATNTCRPDVCHNATIAARENVTNGTGAFDRCVADAKGDLAFTCRCTHTLYLCMIDPARGACSIQQARGPCWRFVNWQNLRCSQKLCVKFPFFLPGI
jgi:hypothetical protein